MRPMGVTMSRIEQLNQWLREVQTDAALNDDGSAAFLIGDQLEVVLATGEQASTILLFAELLPLQGLSPEEITTLCRHSLRFNSHDGLTGDAAVAFDRHQNRLVFNQSIPWDGLDAETLWADYDRFAANALQLWRTCHGQVSEAQATHEHAAAPDQTDPAVPPPQPWTLA